MKKLLFVLSLSLFFSANFSNAQTVFNYEKWKREGDKTEGFVTDNEGVRTEGIFNKNIFYSIESIQQGKNIEFTPKDAQKAIKITAETHKSIQLLDKIFERVDLSVNKDLKKMKFLEPIAKGKINVYFYYYYKATITTEFTKSQIENNFVDTYVFEKPSTKQAELANRSNGYGKDKTVTLFLDNEQVKGDYDYKQYDVLGDKEGTVKGLDLLKMVKDYNAAK
jgi:hypothetical protein